MGSAVQFVRLGARCEEEFKKIDRQPADVKLFHIVNLPSIIYITTVELSRTIFLWFFLYDSFCMFYILFEFLFGLLFEFLFEFLYEFLFEFLFGFLFEFLFEFLYEFLFEFLFGFLFEFLFEFLDEISGQNFWTKFLLEFLDEMSGQNFCLNFCTLHLTTHVLPICLAVYCKL